MIEQDTIKLLRECDAGIQMGVDSIDDVLNRVKSEKMREFLSQCKKEHQELDAEVQELLEIRDKERYVILARVLDGKSVEEIATELGLSYRAVTSILYRCKQKLRQLLEGGDVE